MDLIEKRGWGEDCVFFVHLYVKLSWQIIYHL